MESGLYVVATPIGNLGDISQRALAVMAAADLVAAEDTRHTSRLLQHFNVDVPLQAYHDHSDARAQARIMACLAANGIVVLVSDAGTPLISDPGYRLVREAQQHGFRVVPIPGACAAIAALSASGLPTDRFLFEGFLPAKAGARAARLQSLSAETATLVFYEAPHRVVETLEAMVEAFGADREALLARELTKTFETLRRAPLAELAAFVAADSNQQRGEIVLAVSGQRGRDQEGELSDETARLLQRLAVELPAKRAAAVVADLTGLRKKALYDYLLGLKD
ncbi:MAG: 16S rRNA (cytidine(1402)-2'-O)-methyltransferase [Haliea sp.]|uniref:16S rRNA (cytidine(1402)-2'-O)-methyltransferase n=1 Tax=Haliea sp. TaxID=1932666 RepID=UPI0032ECA4FF